MSDSAKQSSSSQDIVDWLRLLSIFVFPLCLAVLFALRFQPLERFRGEEYLDLARQPFDTPSSLLRPPGYVAFLRFINFAGGGINNDRLAPVYISQGLVLGLAVAAWYITACRWMTPLHAWLMALAFGCNPLAIVLVGYVHYDLLHIGAAVLAGLLLVMVFATGTVNIRWAIPAGIACGAMTLIRPMTLAEPVILALALGVQTKMAKNRGVWLAWAVFSIAMAATIAPRTWANYVRTGRFMPVNAQTAAALWPMFEEPLRPDSNNYPWGPLWIKRGIPLLAARVGAVASDSNFTRVQPLIVDDVFYSRTRELMRIQPSVYFENLAYNIWFILTGDSRLMIRWFIRFQNKSMYALPPAYGVDFFVITTAVLHIFGILGLIVGLRRHDPTIIILASLFICLCVVHSMFYLDFRYIYVKLPFMCWFAGYLLNECSKCPRTGNKFMTWISAMLAMFSLLGTALLVF